MGFDGERAVCSPRGERFGAAEHEVRMHVWWHCQGPRDQRVANQRVARAA